jgi:hypothetical protein
MKPKVFIGSSVKSEDIAFALQEELQHDATVKVWTQDAFQAGSNALDDLIKACNKFDFGIFVFAPEDKVTIKQEEAQTVRDNVLFELGLFLGRLGKERNFYVVPSQSGKSHLATDLEGVTPLKFQMPDSPDDLRGELGPAANQIRKRIKKLGPVNSSEEDGTIIFDSNKGSSAYDLTGREDSLYKGDKPITPKGKGRLNVTNDRVLVVHRTNNEGRFTVSLSDLPVIKPRKIRISFEAQIDGGEHTLNLVLKDEKTKKWSDNKKVTLDTTDWTPINQVLKTPPIYFRIDDQNVSVPTSKVQIRNLVIKDFN